MAYIYKITNQINQHSYIGKTEYVNPNRRWKEHLSEATKQRFNHRAIYRAIQKYGKENFSFEILEETNNPNEREQYYILKYNTYHNGYNETLGGDGTKYLELPEKEICLYYLNHSLTETSKHFSHDRETIKKVLYKNNIPFHSCQKGVILTTSYPVVKIDPKTNEVIQIYTSLSEAEKDNGNTQHIGDVIKGRRKTCKGYKWKKYSDLYKE